MDKILFVNSSLNGGGSERVMATLAGYFADQGVETEMLLLLDDIRVYPVSDKVKITNCFCPPNKSKFLWHVYRLCTLRKAIKNSNADVVISFMWEINMKVLLASIGLKKKIIISERANPNAKGRGKSFHFASKFIFPLAAWNVFQTEQVRSFFSEIIQKKSSVIPNPIMMQIPANSGKREKRIVAAGRLTEQKNFSMLLRAFSAFSKGHPDYSLELYGDGHLKEELRNEANILGIGAKVCFKGFVSNLNEEIRAAAIYASSSNFEGISNSMLEAMALGIPSVCTDCPVGGAAMVINDQENGILVPINDSGKMALAFAKIVDNKQFAARLSHEAQKVKDTYSIENIGAQWLELCRELTKG